MRTVVHDYHGIICAVAVNFQGGFIRILHTISVRWWNACAYYAISIAAAQQKLGHQVWLAGDPGFPATVRARQASLPVVPISFSTRNPLKYPAEIYRLRKFIRQQEIEIINSHRPPDHLLSACLARGVPLVRTVGDVRPPRNNYFNRFGHEELTGFLIFSSEANRVRYRSCWPHLSTKNAVIHGGIDLTQFTPAPKNRAGLDKLGIDGNKITIGQIGRLSYIKDFPTTIKALALVVEERRDVQLIISGLQDQVKVERLKELASSFNIEPHVTFLGSYEPVQELIGMLDIGVVASKGSEAICRIAMEYMAMGIPVVATDVNVLPEIIIDRRNGLIVPVEDPTAMAASLLELINDPVFRGEISQASISDARQRVNIMKAAEETIGIYQKLLENR